MANSPHRVIFSAAINADFLSFRHRFTVGSMTKLICFSLPATKCAVLVGSAFLAVVCRLTAIGITDLRVGGQHGWSVSDDPQPRLVWNSMAEIDGEAAAGYEVIVAKNRADALAGKGTWWKSGLLPLADGPQVVFDAAALPSRAEIWWAVRVIGVQGGTGAWSEVSRFETGLKKPEDWTAQWIGMAAADRQRSAPQFRKSFQIGKPVAKARLYVCGLGWHESWLNGGKLGDEVLQAAQTDYDQRNFYVSHDVTSQIVQGENVLGVWLGDGFFNQDRVWGPKGMSYGEPRLKAQLEVTHPDGTETILATDESWQCKVSPIIESNVYAGETYDARKEDLRWASADFVKHGWQAVVKSSHPGGPLLALNLPPCRRLGTEPVRSVRELTPGTWIYDFGVNLVGWAKFHVEAEAGTKLTVRFAEDLLPDGSLNFATGGVEHTKVNQTATYICRGGGREIWEPRFTYHGFRYAELTITGGKLLSGAPSKDLLEGVIVHTDLTVTGNFECSDDTLNRAFEWANRTFVGNVQGVPTDCPVRERCGWTGDAHLIVPYSMYRFDAASLWMKYTDDIVTTATRSTPMLIFGKGMGERVVKPKAAGIPTMVAPGKRFIGEASPDWGSAIVYIPWDIYLHTGDLRPLKRHYDSMRQWTLHLEGRADKGILRSGLGDWCKPGKSANGEPRDYYGEVIPMLSTACYFRCAKIMADTARLLGRAEDVARFSEISQLVRTSFVREFYGENPSMVPDQTIHSIAVQWGVLPPERQVEAAGKLAGLVKKADHHFMTGVFGSPSLWPTLAGFGHQDVAWKALQNESAPSLKYLAKRGASTFWEVWPMETDEKEIYSRSQSHPFQAGFISWFFSGLAGIAPDGENPGFRVIQMEPQLIEKLDWVKCSFNSPMGVIKSSWARTNATFTWRITVPPGANALLRVPGRIKQLLPHDAIAPVLMDADDVQGKAQRLKLSSGDFTIVSEF
jgi:alpha-L-rhamnosidase